LGGLVDAAAVRLFLELGTIHLFSFQGIINNAIMWESFLSLLQAPGALSLGLWGVGLAAFIAATVLPLSSEVVLLAFVAWRPELLWQAWLVATVGNTMGGMTSYAFGYLGERYFQKKVSQQNREKALLWQARLQHFGPPLTALGWLPVVGDGVVMAAGFLRLNPLSCALWQLLGRGLRYAALLGVLQAFWK
jgi:membrane protein YqaA with SNARE-associated domain